MARRAAAFVLIVLFGALLITPVAQAGERVIIKKDALEKEKAAWLGVTIQDLDESVRDAMGVGKDVTGVLVSDVFEESPAEEAGIKEGDIVVSIGGDRTEDIAELVDAVSSRKPETPVTIELIRGGRKKTVEATLGTRPAKEAYGLQGLYGLKALQGLKGLEALGEIDWDEIAFDDAILPYTMALGVSGWGGKGRLGVYIDDLTEGLAEYFKVPDGKGVLVEDIVDDSPAQKAGIKAGDVLIEIDGHRIGNSEELVERIAKMKADTPTPVAVWRDRKKVTLDATVGEANHHKKIRIVADRLGEAAEKARTKAILLDEYEQEGMEEEIAEIKKELEGIRKELLEMQHELQEELEKLRE